MTQKKFEFKLNDPALVGVAPIELTDGDGSHWGVSDLYEDAYAKLEELVKSGVDFETEWWGSKKEIASARCGRAGGKLWVEVSQSMDEDDELISDAVWALKTVMPPEMYARIDAEIEGAEGDWTDTLLKAAGKEDDPDETKNWLLGVYDSSIGDISSANSGRIEVVGDGMDELQGALDFGLDGTQGELNANFTRLQNRILYLFGLPEKDPEDADD